MTRGRRGFTLLELIIALTISTFVLVGIIAVTTTMVRYQYDSSLKSSVTGGSLYSLQRMQKEIEDTTYLALPATTGATGNVLAGCTNWSMSNIGTDKRIDPNIAPTQGCTGGNNVTSYYYCVSSDVLYRHYFCGDGTTGCRNYRIVGNQPSCGTTAPFDKVVPSPPGFYLGDNFAYYFKRLNDSQVELHYIVGRGTYSVTNKSPQSVKVNVTLTTNKAYGGTSD